MTSNEQILEKLNNNVFIISFKYCDNKIRKYKITLNKDIIPKEAFFTIGPKVERLATVWDVDNERWIAFSWEKIFKLEEFYGTV